ncbi:LIN52 family protein [Megaselia abdita]
MELEADDIIEQVDSDEEALLSLESFDRSSPPWQEKLPGLNNFIKMSDTPIHAQSTASWARGLTQEEINSMHQLGNLSTNQLIKEITKVYDEAYKLGVIEAKEISRGKFLGIFQNSKKSK